jgi:hypothetical protein
MFDTIRLQQLTPLPPAYALRERGFKKPYNSAGGHWFNNYQVNDGCLVKLDWFRNLYGSRLDATLSLPKFLYGNNVQMVESEDEVQRGLAELSNTVSDIAGIKFNAFDADVTGLHVCYNWKLNEPEVYARLNALRGAHLPRMNRVFIDDGGADNGSVYFKNSSEEFVVYAKHAETLRLRRKGAVTDKEVRASNGMLRAEHRLLNSESCKRKATALYLPDKRADSFLRMEIAENILNEKMKQLGLDKQIESGDVRFGKLRNHYGIQSNQYKRLVQFLALADEHGIDNLVSLKLV